MRSVAFALTSLRAGSLPSSDPLAYTVRPHPHARSGFIGGRCLLHSRGPFGRLSAAWCARKRAPACVRWWMAVLHVARSCCAVPRVPRTVHKRAHGVNRNLSGPASVLQTLLMTAMTLCVTKLPLSPKGVLLALFKYAISIANNKTQRHADFPR